ncbi:MAG: hypothetical protein EOO11_19110 [Chitinophagaceae bacterium]|nr:MAG: hypothetical protein EOO11_19110 [Chitinophagaceae bacterium]
MALSENDHELLVRYLDGELDAGECSSLEGRLQQEDALQEGLENLQLATRALHWGALQQQVASARTQHELAATTPATIRRMPWLRYSLAAAAVLLLVWIGTRLMAPAAGPETLYAQHFVEWEPTQLRGGDTAPDQSTAYLAGNFRQVVDDLQQAHRMRGTYAVLKEQYLRGALAAMHLKEWSTALSFLAELDSSAYSDDADYYKALVFLRVTRYGDALALLEKIRNNPAHLYHRQVDDSFIRSARRLAQ